MRFISNKFIIFFLFFLLIWIGCSKNPDAPDYEKHITVFGYLWGNEYLTQKHAIMVAWTQPLFDIYEPEKAAVSGASVSLTAESNRQQITLMESPDAPGFYFNDTLLIIPGETYYLSITSGENHVTATTHVPDNIVITTSLREDTVNEAFPENISRNHPLFIEGPHPQQIILIDVYCLEDYQNAKYIDAFGDNDYPRDKKEYDGETNGEPRHIMAIAPLKEFISMNYPGQYVSDWYSSMIVFYGNYRLECLAIDDNYHKYLYTENPLYESGIEGGLGVFGSVTGKTYYLKILEHQ